MELSDGIQGLHTSKESTLKKRNEIHISQLASVGQIAAGIAHEVKNPLTAVKGFLQLLNQKFDQHYIDIAQHELDNALSTLQNLLQVSKPELEDEPFVSIDLTLELESISQLFQDQFYEIALVKNLANPGTLVIGKRSQLKKAFFNLLKNAFEAIPDQGVVTIEHSATADEVTICISDTGSGIPKKKLDLLGTPFFTTKESGTGMGLALVFSVVYQHDGMIEVDSEEGVGTTFTITFPRAKSHIKNKEVIVLDLIATNSLKDFFTTNRGKFEELLLQEAVNVRDKIDEIHSIGNINLPDNAYRLTLYVVEGMQHEVVSFAKAEGITWAKHSLTLAFKLEWVQAVRRVLWDFLYNYDVMTNHITTKKDYYELEKRINELMDLFITQFFMAYSQYKDNLIRSQREMVEDLSVPIIPLTPSISILPLIGPIDSLRSRTIEDKVINQIGNDHIETLIIDLSGVLEIEPEVIQELMNVIDGIKMMGCQAVITGLRPEVVKKMVRLPVTFEQRATTKGTLQQALVDHLLNVYAIDKDVAELTKQAVPRK